MFEKWGGQRYYPISQFFKKRFQEKVYKITVSTASTCPNRLNNPGGEGCIFCDEWGAAGNHLSMSPGSLSEQIQENKVKLQQRFRVNKFLVYFQPYTSTYTQLSRLQENLETALEDPDVVGVVLGTRPDCLPPEIFPMLKKFHEQSYVSVELGVQSFNNERLAFLNRGHSAECSIEAIRKLSDLSGVDVGVHLILGIPGETEAELREMTKTINQLPVHNIKLHNLHVLENTGLARLYRQGDFVPVDLETYTEKVLQIIPYLKPEVAIQRLTAVAARWDDLVAPEWTKERMRPPQFIQNRLKELDLYQGKFYPEA